LARRRAIPLLVAVCALLALGAAPAQALQLGLEEPHSPNAETISTTYWVMLAIGWIFLLAITGALIVAVVRFREQRGREARRFVAGRTALRPVVGGLTVAALAIYVFGVWMTDDARQIEATGPDGLGGGATAQVGVKGLPPSGLLAADAAEGDPLQINAIAQQWLWRFEYPGGQPGQRTFSYGELVVPVDTAVVLNIGSTDVIHSWSVPALGGQVQATPRDTAQTWFKADEVGRYEGRSTIFSGTSFPAMRVWVRVVSTPEYEAYVEQLASDLNEAQGIVQETELREEAE